MAAVTTTRNGAYNPSNSLGPRTTRVLIVDDHPLFRLGLRMTIESEVGFEVCGEAESLTRALQVFRDTNPDMVIADISLENGSGLELVKQLMAIDEGLKVLVCSMHDEALFAERALRAGARGYISKDESPSRLIDAIFRVKEGRAALSEAMTERLLGRQIGAHDDHQKPAIETLSDRELEVFEKIGRGETTRHIAEILHLSPKTVESYREKIKAKLNLSNASELTQHAVQWVLETA